MCQHIHFGKKKGCITLDKLNVGKASFLRGQLAKGMGEDWKRALKTKT
jgi:hypothetical protein